MIWLIFGLSLVNLALAQNEVPENCADGDTSCMDKIAEFLKKNEVIPDVIENPFKEKLGVNFAKSNTKVDYGNELTPTNVREKPEVTWKADKDSFYTICMTDPDAPSRKNPIRREWLHWLVGNVPGGSIEQGTTIADYIGSAPPKASGLHRYVLLVYKQPKKLTFEEKPISSTSGNGRASFSISKFAKKYNLGDPVAGNFYQAQWDQTSDEIHKTLNGDTMAEEFKKHGVIPDVIETPPKEKMAVNYQESKVGVELGNELTPSQVKLAPAVSWTAEQGSYYVLCMTDPDAPSRNEPTFREILHWLVVNVPGDSIEQGTTLAGYRGSGPPKGTGLHRYIFLAYKQPGKLTFDEKVIPSDSRDGRLNFAVAKFSKKYNLGDPVAGNFFQAQFEDTQPDEEDTTELLKKFGIIPDVIEKAWPEELTVNYLFTRVMVERGNELLALLVSIQPEWVTWSAESKSYYVLAMVDPDAPSRKEPRYREWLHWLVVNIPAWFLEQGTTLAGYIGPEPPNGTDLHRYVLLIYQQPGKLTFDEKAIPSNVTAGRTNFRIAQFAKKYHLGDPKAGNFFQARFHELPPTDEPPTTNKPEPRKDVTSHASRNSISLLQYASSVCSVPIIRVLLPIAMVPTKQNLCFETELKEYSGKSDTLDKMSDELKKHGVIPDVIETPWKELLTAKFPAGNVTADLGNELTPTDVRKKPELSWNAQEGSFYVVCMTDPDAPSRKDPKAREWLHWLVGNVPGNSVKQGTAIADYVGAAPPKGSGLHRYVLLVYKQPRKLTFDEKVISSTTGAGRAKFAVAKFAKKYELGDPVAGNFFQAQWDTIVNDIHKSLK